jgi:hypothetical protein
MTDSLLARHARAEKAWTEHRDTAEHQAHSRLPSVCLHLLLRNITYEKYTRMVHPSVFARRGSL